MTLYEGSKLNVLLTLYVNVSRPTTVLYRIDLSRFFPYREKNFLA